MTRLLQAMAGQAHGGAEAFFERLAIALDRAGETQRLVIRRDEARAARLRRAGLDVVEAPFGGAARFRDAAAAGPGDRRVPARRRADLDEPGEPRLPARRFRACRAARRLLRSEILSRAAIISSPTRATSSTYIVGAGWPADARALPAEFRRQRPRAPVPRASLAHARRCAAGLALGRLHPQQGLRRADRGGGAGCRAFISGSPARARSAPL